MIIFQILLTAANAVIPIVLLILLGYFLKQSGAMGESFIKTGKNLVFKLFLPCLLFINVYDIAGFSAIPWDSVIFGVMGCFVIFLLALATVGKITDVPQRRGVILQCAFRSNLAFIGLPLASALGGETAMAVTSIISSFTIPLFNILAVISLSMFVDSGTSPRESIKKVLRNIITNPMIIAIGLGLICVGIREAQMAIAGEVVFSLRVHGKALYSALNNLKQIASPFSLLMLGGEFELSAVKGMRKEIIAGTLWRIVLAPLLGIGSAILLSSTTTLLHCGPDVYPAYIALFGSPVAVSSVVMAGAMNNDEQLAAQLVVWTSLLSVFTVFLQVCLLMGFGFLPI